MGDVRALVHRFICLHRVRSLLLPQPLTCWLHVLPPRSNRTSLHPTASPGCRSHSLRVRARCTQSVQRPLKPGQRMGAVTGWGAARGQSKVAGQGAEGRGGLERRHWQASQGGPMARAARRPRSPCPRGLRGPTGWSSPRRASGSSRRCVVCVCQVVRGPACFTPTCTCCAHSPARLHARPLLLSSALPAPLQTLLLLEKFHAHCTDSVGWLRPSCMALSRTGRVSFTPSSGPSAGTKRAHALVTEAPAAQGCEAPGPEGSARTGPMQGGSGGVGGVDGEAARLAAGQAAGGGAREGGGATAGAPAGARGAGGGADEAGAVVDALYASPEEAEGGGAASRQSDVFSLGMLFFELFHVVRAWGGRRPWASAAAAQCVVAPGLQAFGGRPWPCCCLMCGAPAAQAPLRAAHALPPCHATHQAPASEGPGGRLRTLQKLRQRILPPAFVKLQVGGGVRLVGA